MTDLGAAITCLLYSVIMERPARQDTCITEISIRGRIKVVYGVVEKISEPKGRLGNVIIPEENKEEAKWPDGINIIAAGNIQEVISFMFEERKFQWMK